MNVTTPTGFQSLSGSSPTSSSPAAPAQTSPPSFDADGKHQTELRRAPPRDTSSSKLLQAKLNLECQQRFKTTAPARLTAPIHPAIAALTNTDPSNEVFKTITGTTVTLPKGQIVERTLDIKYFPDSDGIGYPPGSFSGKLNFNSIFGSTVSTFSVGVIRKVDGDQAVHGSSLMLSAHKTARKLINTDLAEGQSTKGISAPVTPDVVRLTHIQNHGANVVIFKHFEAMKVLSKESGPHSIEDYKTAFNSIKIPKPNSAQSADSYMEHVRKKSGEELLDLPTPDPEINSLDHHNLDIIYPPNVNPDVEEYPLTADVSTFLYEQFTGVTGEEKTLVRAVSRFIQDVSQHESDAAGIYFSSVYDTIDVHVAPLSKEPPLKVYDPDFNKTYDPRMYNAAENRPLSE